MRQFSVAALAAALALAACGPKAADNASTAADNAGTLGETGLNGEGLGGDIDGDNLTAVDGPAGNGTADPVAPDAPLNGTAPDDATAGNSL